MLRAKGNYKRNQNQKLLQGIISEETKIWGVKKQVNNGSWMNSARRMHSAHRKSISVMLHFLMFSAVLSSSL